MKKINLLSVILVGISLPVVTSRAEDKKKAEAGEGAAVALTAAETAGIKNFQSGMAGVKAWWAEATDAAHSNQAAAHRLPGQLREKISQVVAADLPKDLAEAFKGYAAGVKGVAELYKEMPKEDAAVMEWMTKQEEDAKFLKTLEAAQERLTESEQALLKAGGRYGIEKDVDIANAAGGGEEADPSAFLSGESLGGIALDAPAASVLNKLGDPPKIGKNQLMEATGDWVQEWGWPKKGLTVQMGSTEQKGPKTVFSIAAKAGCTMETARGIKIGSPIADVRKAYQDVEDKENAGDADSFVAGSIYGGVIFTLKDGKVTDIFLGAAAE